MVVVGGGRIEEAVAGVAVEEERADACFGPLVFLTVGDKAFSPSPVSSVNFLLREGPETGGGMLLG